MTYRQTELFCDKADVCKCLSHNGFLTRAGYLLRETLTGVGASVRLDRSGSVSGLRRDEIIMEFHEDTIDEQYRRFRDSEFRV